jgi:hypothetical protein
VNLHSLAFGKVFSRDELLGWLYSTGLTISPDVTGLKLIKARAERKRKADQMISEWINAGELTNVDGGYSRGQEEPLVNFVWDNEIHSVKRSDYQVYVNNLKAIRLAQSPEERRKKDTEKRLAEAERTIESLKKELQS